MRSSLTHDQQIAADTEWLARHAREAAARSAVVRPICDTCNAFTAGVINPAAGMGTCKHGHAAVYPGQRRSCADYHRMVKPS